MSTRNLYVLVLVMAVTVAGAVFALTSGESRPNAPASTNKLRIVAAENFWGSIASQIGGDRVSVTSVVSDPNADPHEYESNTATARDFAAADYVIINGAGYDSWAEKLLKANPNPNRTVLNIADFLGKKNGDNPHFWYSPEYVNRVSAEIENDLINMDPAEKQYYGKQYQSLESAMSEYQARIASIKQRFSGTEVAATEDVFAYLADASGLDLISPPAFMQAVAEGNDPPAQSIVQFQNQLKNKKPAVLVYNEQTITPLTDAIRQLAAQEGIPIVGITEIVQPQNMSFEGWMNMEITELENALLASKTGK